MGTRQPLIGVLCCCYFRWFCQEDRSVEMQRLNTLLLLKTEDDFSFFPFVLYFSPYHGYHLFPELIYDSHQYFTKCN